jgi:hypothetical protein
MVALCSIKRNNSKCRHECGLQALPSFKASHLKDVSGIFFFFFSVVLFFFFFFFFFCF